MAKIRAYLIDPEKKEISELPMPGEEKEILQIIGSLFVTRVKINDSGDGIYINDEAMLNTDHPFNHAAEVKLHDFFQIKGLRPIAGKCLIIGRREDGKLQSPYMTMYYLKENTKFLNEEEMIQHL